MTSSKQGNRHALRHGLYARETVLPWENEQAFADLHRSFVDELNPEGPLEDEAVREIAELHWRKQRLAMGYLLPFYRQVPPAELTIAARQGLIALATYLAGNSSTTPGTITATSSQILDFIKGKISGDGAAHQPNHPAPVYTPPTSPPNIVEQAYDPASLVLRLKIETAIDNRITKVMTRLVWLKEYKRGYGQKTVEALPAASPSLVPEPANTNCVTMPPVPVVKKRQWGDPD